MTVEIELTKGYKAIVDDEDADLGIYKWVVNGKRNYYAQGSGIGYRKILMHRIILSRILGRELQKGELCDHINHNGLDNHRANLRIVTARQNRCNCRIGEKNIIGYKNVRKSGNKFLVQIGSFGGRTKSSCFTNIIEAAEVADLIMARLHGEFANLNFPRPIKPHEIKMSKAIEAISDLYPICSQSKFIPRAKDD